ncbi:glyoxalase [Lottiidibacillus patelloidae]|uniref:Glyoxalase n=1 Tax=Lottiidibacillus patelloidae TaxID=2670334 RepID=A0A263BUM6_9BACI|nr:VOC family protein [Lottiidibacillus patelloidae]OZM57451.1 glyoxalase [Lottiidibacillus patelloidae]
MRIKLTSVFVEDQEKALKFYTEVLGFIKKTELPAGEYKWLTVVSKEGSQDLELLLEPNQHPAAKVYQKEIYDAGIPITAFEVDDMDKEFIRLKSLGVRFKQEPMQAGDVTIAVFDDTCGNLIQLYQA